MKRWPSRRCHTRPPHFAITPRRPAMQLPSLPLPSATVLRRQAPATGVLLAALGAAALLGMLPSRTAAATCAMPSCGRCSRCCSACWSRWFSAMRRTRVATCCPGWSPPPCCAAWACMPMRSACCSTARSRGRCSRCAALFGITVLMTFSRGGFLGLFVISARAGGAPEALDRRAPQRLLADRRRTGGGRRGRRGAPGHPVRRDQLAAQGGVPRALAARDARAVRDGGRRHLRRDGGADEAGTALDAARDGAEARAARSLNAAKRSTAVSGAMR